MGNEALVMGYETALDFWRASRVASEGQHVLEDAGRVFGPRALELHERAALAALTSRAELVGYAKSARAVGVRGAGKAVRALDLATGGSSSPRETDLAVFFLLSRRLGGAGLGGFAVNASLEVSQRHREALEGQSEVKPDLLWADARLVVEYDSNAHHLTPKKKESDEARRRVLEAEGGFCTKNGGRLTRRRLLRRAAAPGVVLPGPPAPSACPCAQRGRNEGCADGC